MSNATRLGDLVPVTMPVFRQHSYRPALTYISTAALQDVWATVMRRMGV